MTTDILVPDIGDFKDVEVIDVLVKPGDRIELETPLITLETEKATMDVPASAAGVVKSVAVKKGDRVSKGSLVLTLDAAAGQQAKSAPAAEKAAETPKTAPQEAAPPKAAPAPTPAPSAQPSAS